jgi:hypothetical protein
LVASPKNGARKRLVVAGGDVGGVSTAALPSLESIRESKSLILLILRAGDCGNSRVGTGHPLAILTIRCPGLIHACIWYVNFC